MSTLELWKGWFDIYVRNYNMSCAYHNQILCSTSNWLFLKHKKTTLSHYYKLVPNCIVSKSSVIKLSRMTHASIYVYAVDRAEYSFNESQECIYVCYRNNCRVVSVIHSDSTFTIKRCFSILVSHLFRYPKGRMGLCILIRPAVST